MLQIQALSYEHEIVHLSLTSGPRQAASWENLRTVYLQAKIWAEGEIQIQIEENTVHVGRSVKNSGMYFDTSLTTGRHANAISSVCYIHIRNIDRIKQYFMTGVSKTLAHALVTHWLDYGNSIQKRLSSSYGTSAKTTEFYSPDTDCIKQVLNSLQWLPVIHNTQYKILVCTYEALDGTVSQYLEELVACQSDKIRQSGIWSTWCAIR